MSQDNELSNIKRDLRHMERSRRKHTNEEWLDMHRRIIQLPRTDRRQLYRDKDYVPLEGVLDWQQTCSPDKRITVSDASIRIPFDINKRVAICNRHPKTIECDAILSRFPSSAKTRLSATRSGRIQIGFVGLPETGPVIKSGRFFIHRVYRLPTNNIYELNEQRYMDEGAVFDFLTVATQSGCRSLAIDLHLTDYFGQLDSVMLEVKRWLKQNYNLVDKLIFCTEHSVVYKHLKESMPTHFPVYVENIPESKLPAEILRMDSRSIEIFKKALSNGKHVVHNIRVMLVGHSGVGKTTILKRLLGQEVDIDRRESTDGIEVHVHRCKVDIDSGQWTLCEDDAPDPNKVLASSMLRVSADESVLPPVRESSPQPGTSRDDNTEVIYTRMQNVSSRTESDTDEPLSKKAKLEVGASSGDPTSICGSSSTSIEDSTKGNETQLAQTLKEVIQASNNLRDSKFAKVSFWDFAGQSIFYNTHQVFLAPQTIFLLVTSLKQDIDEVVPEVETGCLEKNGTKVRDFVDFWANSVRYFCGEKDTTGPPIILLATHADKVDQARKEVIIENHFQKIRDIFDDKVTAEHIVDDMEFAIDNTRVDSQLEKLKSAIFDVAKEQDYWNEEYPNRWLTFENEFLKKRQSGRKIMTLEEVKNINRRQSIPLEETEELDLFLRFHHQRGTIMYFSEPTLSDYILLDPQWVVDALKSIITADNFLKRKGNVRKYWKQLKETGKLTTNIIDAVWGQSEFIKYKDVLLLIMERLCLIAKPNDDDPNCDHYFVPCFITKRQINPRALTAQSVTSVLKLDVPSRFFPMVLFNKLIASCVGQYPIYQNHIYNGSAAFVVGVHVFTVLYVDSTVKVWVTTPSKINPDVCQCILNFLIERMEKLSCTDMPSVDVRICCPNADLYSVNDIVSTKVPPLPKDIKQWKSHVPEEILCSNASCEKFPIHLRQDCLRHWIPGSQGETHQTYKEALNKAWVSLVEEMHSDELLDRIEEKRLFSQTAIQDLRDERSTYHRNIAVLKKVSTSGQEKYEVFKECLPLIKQEHLVKLLLKYETERAATDEVEASVTPEMESKLPAEILRKGSRAIQIYKKALSDGKHAVQNIRVMLVGHSGVGKTTLLKRLLDQDVDIKKKIESTEGIEVHVHRCKIDVESGRWHCQDKAPPHPNAALLSAILPLLTVTPQESILQPVQDTSPEFDTSPTTNDEFIYRRQQNVTGVDVTIASEPESDKSENTSEADVHASIVHGTYLSQDHAALDHLTQYDATLNVGKGCEVRPQSSSSKSDDTKVKQQFKELMETYESKNLSDSNFANVSFWDFAGQYIFYNTHQVFLSHRTVYLLVTKLNHILDEAGLQRQDCDTKPYDTIKFWVDSIHFFCGKENHDPRVPPVILVATHADKADQSQKEILIQNHFQKVRNIFANKITAGHIVDDLEFAVDNSIKDPEMERLKKEILEVAKTQYYWQEEHPVRWLTLEKELFVKGNSGEKVLQLEAVKDINRMLPFPLEETELDLFLQFQSDLGNILYISEGELKDYVLLNPQWVADAFKCIITAEQFLNRKMMLRDDWDHAQKTGKMKTEIIEAVWSDKKSEGFFEERKFLLLLMQQLNLIARPIGSEQPPSHYFVPCLIRERPSCLPIPFKGEAISSVLALSAASRFFPLILFHKLIASCIQKYQIHKKCIYDNSALFEDGVHVFTVLYVDNTVKVWVKNLAKAIPDSKVCQSVLKFLIECLHQLLQLSCSKTPSVAIFICCPKVDVYSVQGMHQLPNDTNLWQAQSKKNVLCTYESCESHSISMRDALKHWIQGTQNAEGVLSDPNILARCPTLQEVVRMSGKIGKEFSMLGIMLGLSYVDIDHVARENPKNAVSEINAMLNLWLTREGSKATIGLLKKAMEDVGIDTETVLAQSLETSCADADS